MRRAVADVVAAVGRFEIPANQWPDLLQYLNGLRQARSASQARRSAEALSGALSPAAACVAGAAGAQSGVEDHRVCALLLFCALTEGCPEALRPHMAALGAVCHAGLTDGARTPPRMRPA